MKMESQTPRISVIVPVYNVEQYLPRCIDSILAQTFTDFELLLIDDGSKDKSGAICDAYARKDPRIRVFHKPNGGVSSARNMGLDNAKGEWIAFVDSDDWVNEDFLANFVEIDSGEDLLSQGFCSPNWDGLGNVIVTQKTEKYCKGNISQYIIEMYKSGQLGYIWCKLFKKEIINECSIKFIPEFVIREDLAFVCQYCANISSIGNTSKFGYNYIYPSDVGKYVYKDSLSVCRYVYHNIRRIFSCNEINIFNRLYIDAVICPLIESCKISNEDHIFFYKYFSSCIKECNSHKRKVKLFKKLYIIHEIWYLKILVSFMRLIYRIKRKKV